MKSKFFPVDPDSIRYTASLTMTLGQWKELSSNLDEKYYGPTQELRDCIWKMVSQATKNFNVEEEPEEAK